MDKGTEQILLFGGIALAAVYLLKQRPAVAAPIPVAARAPQREPDIWGSVFGAIGGLVRGISGSSSTSTDGSGDTWALPDFSEPGTPGWA